VTTPLSILVLTFNEEANVEACLASVCGWADDIVVLDSGSTDRTLAICSAFGASTTFHPYVDHRSQMEWGITGVPWKHAWLLLLDADNVVSTELKGEIDALLKSDDPGINGYYNPHEHYFRNRRVRGLKANWLRLIRRGSVRVDESELVDFRLIVEGRTGSLTGAIVETNQKELDIDFWIDKHQKFARRMAVEEVLRREHLLEWSKDIQPRLGGNSDERTIWFKNHWYRMPLYVRPFLYFLYRYFVRLGFLDGWNGFVYHFLQAFWFRLLVDIHIGGLRGDIDAGRITLAELMRQNGLVSDEMASPRTRAVSAR
jgi:glycosyltransferase involved in cell wall biosynthesis